VSTAECTIVEDLNSTNGVFIKSKRISQHNLNDGDVISIGDHELVYIDDRQARRAAREYEDTGTHDGPAPNIGAMEAAAQSTSTPPRDGDSPADQPSVA
jgi:pSer/pThr/pTyr-binding forkhead associated (FHA) protein